MNIEQASRLGYQFGCCTRKIWNKILELARAILQPLKSFISIILDFVQRAKSLIKK